MTRHAAPDPRTPPAASRSRGQPGRESRAGLASVAAEIIARSSREQPADRLLRNNLREELRLGPGAAASLSRLVFAYFRWRGWLNPAAPLPEQVQQASVLARRFREEPAGFPEEELRARSLPAWAAEVVEPTPRLVRWLQSEPVLWLRARPGTGRAVAAELGDCVAAGPGKLADSLRYGGTEDLFRTEAFRSGRFEIQDLHSQAVGWLCAPSPGDTWWDACAGEGGKTLHLSDLMENRGLIWASDAAAWRLDRLKLRARRAGVFNYRAALWDGGERLPTRTRFDGVLVDAPCTNVGTWQRNPHARWTVRPEDVEELAALQLRLLRHAAPAVKPGGRLVYSVCTLTRPETVGVVEAFQSGAPGFEAWPVPSPLQPGRPHACQVLEPGPSGGNGMFVAVWKRAA